MDNQKQIKRDAYLAGLIAKQDNGLVKVITGVRRCGKSYLLFTLYRQYLWENGVAEGTHIGRISNIADTRPIRYTVPLVWDKNSAGTVALCLNFMHANFAVEQIEISTSEQEK